MGGDVVLDDATGEEDEDVEDKQVDDEVAEPVLSAEPADDEGLQEQQQAENNGTCDEESDGRQFPEYLHRVLVVALGDEVAHASVHAVAEDVDQKIQL